MFENTTPVSESQTLLIDVSHAQNSARACQMVEDFLVDWVSQPRTAQTSLKLELNAGGLFLTRGVMNNIKQLVRQFDAQLATVYSAIPQTQQAAIDEGCYVRGQLESAAQPIRMPLPMESIGEDGIDLPFATGKNTLPPPSKPYAMVPPIAPAREQAPAPSLSFEPSPSFEIEEESAEEEEGETLVGSTLETLYVRQTLRSGQTIRFNGNVVIVGDAHAGSEVIAGGDIIVWGELKGIAHAGAQGNYRSEIRAMKIEALQLRIADYIARRPDRIFYHKEANANLPGPEVAKVADGEIKNS